VVGGVRPSKRLYRQYNLITGVAEVGGEHGESGGRQSGLRREANMEIVPQLIDYLYSLHVILETH
jgi:hypothetical protein